MTRQRVAIRGGADQFEIEVAWVGAAGPQGAATQGAPTQAPLMVFLHEGLGSVAMWKDFPARLCAACGVRGLVYSRPGYGGSTPRPSSQRWPTDFMHRQAEQVLPALLDALEIGGRYLLFGHSDGGSIALIHAAHRPGRVAGAIVLAPHILVEEFGLVSIRQARDGYRTGDLRPRLARFHDDVDSAFWGWNDIWLSPEFLTWRLDAELGRIRCPVLAIQGVGDPYGTMAQIEGIAARVPGTTCLKLENCGHSPHRDQPDAVIAASASFCAAITGVSAGKT
jgi:pimeloyl-ACP methyl ester carboxylesterase